MKFKIGFMKCPMEIMFCKFREVCETTYTSWKKKQLIHHAKIKNHGWKTNFAMAEKQIEQW